MSHRKSFPELADWLPQAQAPITDHLGQFVRCLAVGHSSGRVEAWASAVSAVHSGRPILLTARHAVQELDGRPLLLEAQDRFQLLAGSLRSAESESADVAVIELPEAALDWGISFIDLDLQIHSALKPGEHAEFIAMGFPTRDTTPVPRKGLLGLKRINYWTVESPGTYDALDLDESVWLATKYERKRSYQAGAQLAMKLPHGMSGGALWRFAVPEDEFASLDAGSLAGVLVKYREGAQKCMLSARISVLQELATSLD